LTSSTSTSASALTVISSRRPAIASPSKFRTPAKSRTAKVGLWAKNDSNPVANACTVKRLWPGSSR
jgi:hypothetical protein